MLRQRVCGSVWRLAVWGQGVVGRVSLEALPGSLRAATSLPPALVIHSACLSLVPSSPWNSQPGLGCCLCGLASLELPIGLIPNWDRNLYTGVWGMQVCSVCMGLRALLDHDALCCFRAW